MKGMQFRPLFWTLLFGILLSPFLFLYVHLHKLETLLNQKRYPHFIFITIDTLRADRLACYGNARIKTPVIDRIAKESAQFSNCFCQIPITNPSHCSFFTGLQPHEHGILTNGVPISGDKQTLATRFKAIGYKTAAFISGFSLVKKISGLHNGFEIYDDAWSAQKVERSGSETTQAALQWIDDVNKTKSRFFLWIHYFDPHQPYQPEPPYNSFYASEGMVQRTQQNQSKQEAYKEHAEQAREAGFFNVLVKESMAINPTQEQIEWNLAQYDSEISVVDREIGKLMNRLAALKLLHDTVIVLTADHGEGFDHNYFFTHGDRLYDSSLHIPALFWFPDMKAPVIVDELAQSVDFFPTILETFHIFGESKSSGQSLKLSLLGQKMGITNDCYSVTPGLNRPEFSQGPLTSIRTSRWKMIYHEKKETYELYDLQSDPEEKINIWGTKPRIQADLEKRINEFITTRPAITRVMPKEIDSEVRERLKQLGYLQ